MTRKRSWQSLVAGSAIAIVLSCDSSSVTGLASANDGAGASGAQQSLFGPKPISCPANESISSTADVGPLGGIVSVGGTSISIPAGALLNTVTVTVTVPASNYMEIDVSVAGQDHFEFLQTVVVTVDYARCNRSNFDLTPLTAWHWDPVTKTLLEPMPSVDNKLLDVVTFTTIHLSGYILAN